MRASGSPTRCIVAGGFAEVTPERCTVLANEVLAAVDLSREEGERRLAEAEAALRDGRGVGRRGRGTGAGTHPVGAGAGRGGGRAADRAVAPVHAPIRRRVDRCLYTAPQADSSGRYMSRRSVSSRPIWIGSSGHVPSVRRRSNTSPLKH